MIQTLNTIEINQVAGGASANGAQRCEPEEHLRLRVGVAKVASLRKGGYTYNPESFDSILEKVTPAEISSMNNKQYPNGC
ncbi:hypothetical protein [Chitinimonas sp. BJB300]|uniref:hypothetical protein n=1 Tax=Chitinimonas sp. BJB300 TaxID=1559339 RepID=UPI0011124F02|nr:hypothetical protein [Chitinimonas sp. BJB300]TSJ82771.1 hypothetical protein FG002_021995 [Chitinimonas sp. BJB300]